MFTRKSFKFKNLKLPVILKVKTKCPEKWILIDRETGQTYRGNESGAWDRLDPVIKKNDTIL